MNAHWAADLIGRSYREGSAGPDDFDCWGLVRWVFENVHGIQMPMIAVGRQGDGSPENVSAIKRAASVSGWRPSHKNLPEEHDIALMLGIGGTHVGVMVRANGGLFLLHCIEDAGVCLQSLPDLSRLGFRDFNFWRREA